MSAFSSSDFSKLLCVTHLLGFPPPHAWLDLAQYLAHKQDAIDHDTVGGTLDLEVAEECVGAEEGEDLIERVVRLVRCIDSKLCDVRGQRRELLCRSTGSCAQRQERKVAWNFGERERKSSRRDVLYQ